MSWCAVCGSCCCCIVVDVVAATGTGNEKMRKAVKLCCDELQNMTIKNSFETSINSSDSLRFQSESGPSTKSMTRQQPSSFSHVFRSPFLCLGRV